MKKRIVYPMLAILLCGVTFAKLGGVSAYKVNASDRTVLFDGFEDGTSSWGHNGNCNHEVVADAHGGEKALQSTKKEGVSQNRIQHSFTVGQDQIFTEGYEYTISFYAKSSEASGIEGIVYIYDDQSGSLGLKVSASTDNASKTSTEWQLYTFSFQMDVIDGVVNASRTWTDGTHQTGIKGSKTDVTKVTSINILMYTSCDVWFMDDFTVTTNKPEAAKPEPEAIPDGYRLVDGYDFEDDALPFTNGGTSTHTITDDSYSGDKALKSTRAEGKTQNRIQKEYEFGAGKLFQEGIEYTISFYAKSSEASGIEGYVYIYDDQSGSLALKVSAPTDNASKTSTEWQKYTVSFSAEVVDGVVNASRTWTDGTHQTGIKGSKTDVTKVTSINILMFTSCAEWYMDDFRIITDQPIVKPEPEAIPDGYRLVDGYEFEDDALPFASSGTATHTITDDSYSGDKALKSTRAEGKTQNRIQKEYEFGADKLFQEGAEYTISFYAKSSEASGIEGYVYIYDDQSGSLGLKVSAPTDNASKTSTEWQKYTVSFSAEVVDGVVNASRTWTTGTHQTGIKGSKTGVTKITSINILMFTSCAEWYMDEFKIITDAPLPKPQPEPIPDGYYLIHGHDFEDDALPFASSGTATHTITDDSHCGDKALKSTLNDGKTQNRIQKEYAVGEKEDFHEGAEYQVSFYAKSSEASGINGYVYIYDDKGGSLALRVSDAGDEASKTSTEWQKYTFSFQMDVIDGVVNASRTWTTGTHNTGVKGSKTDVTKVTSINVLLYTGCAEWYMDDFRIISTAQPYVAPATKDYSFDRMVEDFNDSDYAGWVKNSNAELQLVGEDNKELVINKVGESSPRFQTKLYYDQLDLNDLMPFHFDFDAKGDGKVFLYIQFVSLDGQYSRTIQAVSGSSLTSEYQHFASDMRYDIDDTNITYSLHRPNYAPVITVGPENDYPSGAKFDYIDVIFEFSQSTSVTIDNIKIYQAITLDIDVADIVDQIDAIGEVTYDKKAQLEAIKTSYEALEEEKQELVFNYGKLNGALLKIRLMELAPNNNLDDIQIDYSAKDYTGQEILPTSELVSVKIYDAQGNELKPLLPNKYVISRTDLYYEGALVHSINHETPKEFVINKLANEAVVSPASLMYDPNSETYMLDGKYELSAKEDFSEVLPNSGSISAYANKVLYVREKETETTLASAAVSLTLEAYTVTLPQQVGFVITPVTDKEVIFKGGYYKFELAVSDGYEGTPVVKVNGEVIEEDDGLYSISVLENISIIVEGVTEHVEQPSEEPSEEPSVEPSEQPSVTPSEQPSVAPSVTPSVQPSEQPSEQASTPAEETSKQEEGKKKGCKGEAATSLFGLLTLAGALILKKRK